MDIWPAIEQHISASTGTDFIISQRQALGGGCINRAQHLQGGGQEYFVKLNDAANGAMFAAEAAALELLAQTNTVRVPRPVCHGLSAGQCYLVLQYLPLGGRPDMSRLGRELAALHQCSGPYFGWEIDNTIGSTPQDNTPSEDWTAFWRERRLRPQLALAASNGHGGELQALGERLLAEFPVLFASYTPAASMLHGDLWGGNCGALDGGQPVLFDPAFYYGDRESDLAMTTLFGGFSEDFHAAYREAWPLDPGYPVRAGLYNLYHLLNHLNLFGGGYHAQAVNLARRVLSELQ